MLWEITWCVILYSIVLVMEVLAVTSDSDIGERWPWFRKLGHFLHTLTPILAVIGMGLSLLHQSSLGATYSVLSGRAIWFKPSLPVMFIISAVAGGMALTVLASLIVGQFATSSTCPRRSARGSPARSASSRWDTSISRSGTGRRHPITATPPPLPASSPASTRLRRTPPPSGVEILLSGLVPAVILLLRTCARRRGLVMLALGLIVARVVIDRWNITLSGLVAPPEWSPGVLGNVIVVFYFPSPTEIVVALGIWAYALLGFTLGVKNPEFTRKRRDNPF